MQYLASKIINRLYFFFIIFIKAPKEYKSPRGFDVLIYDKAGSEEIIPLLKGSSWHVLALRGEVVNVRALFFAILSFEFWSGGALEAYINSYIKLVDPKLIITFTDNDQKFYKISQNWPNIKTAFIQNGYRGGPADLFENIAPGKHYHVDFMFCFSNAIATKYSKYITGNTVIIGSLKNNNKVKSVVVNSGKPKDIVFISQFLKPKRFGGNFIATRSGTVSFEQFYQPEIRIFPLLVNWCKVNNYRLLVLGRSWKDKQLEADFYNGLAPPSQFKITYPCADGDAYDIVDSASLVVFIDSTLGYESLARGNKTAAFGSRGKFVGSNELSFGWPATFTTKGKFWTDSESPSEILRVLNFLDSVGDDEWKNISQGIVPLTINYDPGNIIIRNKLRTLFKN